MKKYIIKDRCGRILYEVRKKEEAGRKLGCSADKIRRMIHKPLESDDYLITVVDTLPDYLWLIVSHDKYEFPLAIFDSGAEMKRALGLSDADIYSAIKHSKDRGTFCRYRKVYIGDV